MGRVLLRVSIIFGLAFSIGTACRTVPGAGSSPEEEPDPGAKKDAGADRDAGTAEDKDAGAPVEKDAGEPADAATEKDSGAEAAADAGADGGIDAGAVPSAPTGLSAELTTPTEVTLRWTDTSLNEESFKIERKGGMGAYTARTTLSPNTTTWTETLSANMLYYYRVYAENAFGRSAPSGEVVVITPPAAPTNLAATLGATNVSLAWTASPGATSYEIWRRAGDNPSYALVGTAIASPYVDNAVIVRTKYTYVVRALTFAGSSGDSNEATVQTWLCEWGTERRLGAHDGDASAGFPQPSVDGVGNSIVAWVEVMPDESIDAKFERYSWDAGRWEDAGAITTMPYLNEMITIAPDPRGSWMLAWGQADGVGASVRSSRFDLVGGTWGAPSIVSEVDSGTIASPRIGIDVAGNVLVAWTVEDGTGGPRSLWSRRWVADSGAWAGATAVEGDDDASVGTPLLSMNRQGDSAIAWTQELLGMGNTFFNSLQGSIGSWGSAQVIAGSDSKALAPAVAVSEAGSAFVLWGQEDEMTSSIRWNRFEIASGVWGDGGTLNDGAFPPTGGPQVVVDPTGNAIATWMQVAMNGWDVVAAHYSEASGKWGAPAMIGGNTLGVGCSVFGHEGIPMPRLKGSPEGFVTIAVDGAGNGHVVWIMCSGEKFGVWANLYDSTAKIWYAQRAIEAIDGGVTMLYPKVAAHPAGGAIAGWTEMAGTRVRAWVNVCR